MNRAVTVSATCVILLFASCGSDESGSGTVDAAIETVALGVLPEPPSQTGPGLAQPSPPPITDPDSPDPTDPTEPIEPPVGDVVAGNRLLLIGDSAMVTLTEREEGLGCLVLADLGWQVQIEAEVARFLPFADEVIDEVVLDAAVKPDVVGLMFGHALDTSPEEFGIELERIVGRLSPGPVLLYTVPENDDETSVAVNDEIRALATEHHNVVVVDWADAVAAEELTDLVDAQRLPTAEGMGRIVLLTAAAVGEPAAGGFGRCIEPVFNDDSAIVLAG